MKFCTKCDIRQDLKNFPKAPKTYDRLGSWCKECVNEYKRAKYAVDKDKILLAAKTKRAGNIEKIRAREKQWRDSSTDRQKGTMLLKYWPGKTWQQALTIYRGMIKEQNNLCAICDMPETCLAKKGSKKLVRDLCVDHCHATGLVRGLLCDKCNSLLGNAKDSPIICISAAGYLRRALNAAIS